jgi:signal transduction histidine kinase
MRDTAEQLITLDLTAGNTESEIIKIEQQGHVMIEIYTKAEPQKAVYAKYQFSNLNTSGTSTENQENASPLINYPECDSELNQEYSDNSYSVTLNKNGGGNKFFALVTPDETRDYLYITAVDYSVIVSQAKSIAIATVILTTLITIAVSIVFFFYITRITRPLSDIIHFTGIMSEGGDKSVRIPSDNDVLTPQSDRAITNINALYESLMLTQERLVEKSFFLAEQLEEKEAEQLERSKFIGNISHELKTPISIIQGYAEGMKYVLDDQRTAGEYCDTIIEECERMTDLVVDMMSLTNIQQSGTLEFTNFIIREFVEERIKLHSKIFENKSITAENRIESGIIGYADISKLQFVVNNLISNAVSYIGGENKRILVRSEDIGSCYRIFVYNTGSPIPPGNLDKLWDSFYREDNARLRSEGHFGLGLSIVKAVQDAHSQQCGVNNTENGVEFWFDIAKGTK